MAGYRVREAGDRSGKSLGSFTDLERAMKLAEELIRSKPGSQYVVEKFDQVWPKLGEDVPKHNLIHASIHTSNRDIGN